MAFAKKSPQWHAVGTEPPESLKQSGFQAGYKPPAEFFNWQWHAVGEAIDELQGMKPEDIGALSRGELDAHLNADNPHGLTAEKLDAARKQHTHAQAEVTGLTEALDGKAAATIPMTVVAPASAWAMVDAGYYAQTLTVGIMTANSNAIVGLSDTATAAQARECRWAKIRPMAQGAGTLTLAADGSRPEVDLPVSIMIIG